MTFTASNGVPIRRANGGYLTFSHEFGLDLGTMTGITVSQEQALREFFMYEQGIWIDVETGALALLNQAPVDGRYLSIFLNGTMYGVHEPKKEEGFGSAPQQQVAKRFFEAHPEWKPWHSPDAGDHWALHIAHGMALSGDERLYKYTRWGASAEWRYVPTAGGSVLLPTDPSITSGRRIWPEGDAS